MRKIFLYILLLSHFNSLSQVDTTSNLSDSDKLYGLSLFWKEASYNFVYFSKININWDSAYQAFIPQVLQTKSTFQYYRLLKRFAALLKDGHTDVQYPRSLFKGSTNTQVHFEYIEGKLLVKNVPLEDSALVPFASEVISINDSPTSRYLETEVLPYISSSTQHWLYRRAISMIYPLVDTTKYIKLGLKTLTGDTLYYNTKLTSKNKRMAYDNRLIKFIQYKEFSNGIIYFNIYTFQDTSAISRFKKVLPQLYNAKGIILDLRANGGGNSDIGIEILKYFTDQKNIKTSAAKTLNHMAAYKAWGKYYDLKDTINDPNNKDLYIKSYFVSRSNYWYNIKPEIVRNSLTTSKIRAPLVVLIGNETASAAEDFLVALNDINGRATMVGEKTEGSTGQPLYFDLPGGGSARICTLVETYPNGKEFVGIGIVPDIEIKKSIADLIAGRDPSLEKALEILKKKIRSH